MGLVKVNEKKAKSENKKSKRKIKKSVFSQIILKVRFIVRVYHKKRKEKKCDIFMQSSLPVHKMVQIGTQIARRRLAAAIVYFDHVAYTSTKLQLRYSIGSCASFVFNLIYIF